MRVRIKHGVKQVLVEVHILGVKKYTFWSKDNEESRSKAPVILRNNVKRRKRHLVDPEPVYVMGDPPSMVITEIHFTQRDGVTLEDFASQGERRRGKSSRYQTKKNKKKEKFQISCPQPLIRT